MKLRELSVLFLPLLVAGAAGQSSIGDYDPVKQFCRRFYHQSAIIGERLYIDGGYITSAATGENKNFTNPRLLFHNLGDDDTRTAPLVNNLTKPAEAPSVIGGTLWADQVNEKLYLFGGEYPDAPPSSNAGLWSYDPWVDQWSRVQSQGAEFSRPSFGAAVAVDHMATGFYYGGWLGENNVAGWQGPRVALNTMIIYNMVENTFQNVSGPAGRDPRVEGVMVYVPVGDQGLLVMFGGVYAKNGSENELYPVPMNEIDVYDISQRKWYREFATATEGLGEGKLPESRKRFCAGRAGPEDGSSHNVYIYGGASTTADSPGSDDVWILTMPGFRWIKYFDQGTPRAIHNGFSCDVVGNSQMIVLGGTFPHDTKQCDAPEAQGSHYMDLGTANKDNAEWYGYRKNITHYTVPADIISVIKGGPDGRATVRTPEKGFANNDLVTLFQRKLDVLPREPTRTPTPLAEEFRPQGAATNAPKKSGPSLALILGPAVGAGVPVVCLLMGFIVFCRRRRSNGKDMQPREHIHSSGADRKGLKEINIPQNVYGLPITQRSPKTAGSFPPGYPGSNFTGHYGYDRIYKETQPLPSIPIMSSRPPPARPDPAIELPTSDIPHELPAAPMPARSASASAANYYHHTGHQQQVDGGLWRSPSEPWGNKNKNAPPPGMI